MKIKISRNFYVNLSSLIRFEWLKFYPVLIVHEKFEKWVKYTLRVIAVIGIATSVISIEKWYNSLILSIVIFFVEQFFERTIFEYTTLVIQPFPEFEIDYSEWKANAFMIAQSNELLSYMGPAYQNEEYGNKFFSYIKSWNSNEEDDVHNNIVLTFVMEPNQKYTTYIYPNIHTRSLDRRFNKVAKKNALKKYGKRQQQMVAQMVFWHTQPYRDGSIFQNFLRSCSPNNNFYFIAFEAPSENNPMKALNRNKIENSVKQTPTFHFKLTPHFHFLFSC